MLDRYCNVMTGVKITTGYSITEQSPAPHEFVKKEYSYVTRQPQSKYTLQHTVTTLQYQYSRIY
jgi:hypothetical protein